MGRVACIGAGAIGGGIAGLAVRGGWQVTLSNSRGPEALAGLLADLGSGASALPLEDAVKAADLIVLSIPFGRYKDLPADIFAGKIVIDTMSYAPGRGDGGGEGGFTRHQPARPSLFFQCPERQGASQSRLYPSGDERVPTECSASARLADCGRRCRGKGGGGPVSGRYRL